MRLLVAAVLGAGLALGIGAAAGLLGGSTTATVVVREPPAGTSTPARVVVPVSSPGFSPARIFARRSPGVVTVFAYFASEGAQGSGFVVSDDGTILTNAHVITNAGEGGPVRKAGSVYVEFADHDRVPARIVGWDVFDDVGVLRVDPARHPLGRTGHVAYACAGIEAEDLTPARARRLRLPVSFGALVDAVTSGGPADKAGIRGGSGHVSFEGQTVVSGGDVVVAVDGVRV